MTKLNPEQIHVQVAHQERYQLRKAIRLIKAHRKGAHKHSPLVTCDECTLITAPLKPAALPAPDSVEKNKEAASV